MRPLKPYAIALGGLIAAVFGAVFFGAYPGNTSVAPPDGLRPDLSAKRAIPSADITVSRAARADRNAPTPPPHFPQLDFSSLEAVRALTSFGLQPAPRGKVRLQDQRLRLLIGVVELRI